jgi:hypothetical protein
LVGWLKEEARRWFGGWDGLCNGSNKVRRSMTWILVRVDDFSPSNSRGWWSQVVCVGVPCSVLDSCRAFPSGVWEVRSAVGCRRRPLLGWAVGRLGWELCLSPLVVSAVGVRDSHRVSVTVLESGGRDMGPLKVVWVRKGGVPPCYGCCVLQRWMIRRLPPRQEG